MLTTRLALAVPRRCRSDPYEASLIPRRILRFHRTDGRELELLREAVGDQHLHQLVGINGVEKVKLIDSAECFFHRDRIEQIADNRFHALRQACRFSDKGADLNIAFPQLSRTWQPTLLA